MIIALHTFERDLSISTFNISMSSNGYYWHLYGYPRDKASVKTLASISSNAFDEKDIDYNELSDLIEAREIPVPFEDLIKRCRPTRGLLYKRYHRTLYFLGHATHRPLLRSSSRHRVREH